CTSQSLGLTALNLAKYTGIPVCGYTSIQEYRNTGIPVYRSTGTNNLKSESLSLAFSASGGGLSDGMRYWALHSVYAGVRSEGLLVPVSLEIPKVQPPIA